MLGRSAGIALLIAVLASVVGWPAAWALRRAGAGWFVVLVSPLLMPSYLAYAGWGVLRSPDTAVGKWLMMGTRDAAGINRWSVGADYVLAVGGLVLWSWPLAALVCAVRLRRIDESVFEAMRMDVRGRVRRMGKVVWMCRGAVGAAVGLVGLVMLGSALPLHLAKLDTFAIKIWRVLDETPQDQRGKVWIVACPFLAPSRSTMCRKRAPASTHARAASSGESRYTVLSSKSPLTRRTAWPSRMSMAG